MKHAQTVWYVGKWTTGKTPTNPEYSMLSVPLNIQLSKRFNYLSVKNNRNIEDNLKKKKKSQNSHKPILCALTISKKYKL